MWKTVLILLNMFRILPAYLFVQICPDGRVRQDVQRWQQILQPEYPGHSRLMFFGYLLVFKLEFRNVLFRLLFHKMEVRFVPWPSMNQYPDAL